LLKIHDYEKEQGNSCKIVRGKLPPNEIGIDFIPDRIFITSLFTYWSEFVWNTVDHYRNMYPDAMIIIGGIYASLMGETLEFKKRLRKYSAEVNMGLYKEAEEYAGKHKLNYSTLESSGLIDYQIIHASRGCVRHCSFCGTWKIEPKFEVKKTIMDEICKTKLVFYDNNLLANPFIEDILDEIIEMKENGKIEWCESQSGFDGRKLEQKPILAHKLKKAGFRHPRIAWDGAVCDYETIFNQIELLKSAGYNAKEIMVFMVYNWNLTYEEMEVKRLHCFEWGVQISDCRFRPLNQLFDYYSPRKKNQNNNDYHISSASGWNDDLVKEFRANVRRQNICIRHNLPFYSVMLEHNRIEKARVIEIKNIRNQKKLAKYLNKNKIDSWFPNKKEMIH
jgi:hypothetical protein